MYLSQKKPFVTRSRGSTADFCKQDKITNDNSKMKEQVSRNQKAEREEMYD